MSNRAELGVYQLTLDQRGLRIERRGGKAPIEVAATLAFTLTEADRPPVPLTLHRLTSLSREQATLHGYTRQEVAFDANLSYAPDVQGIEIALRVENVTQAMQVRLSAELLLPGEADPHWFIPGLFYADNRPAGTTRVYPSYSELGRDNRKMIAPAWAFRSDRAAAPMVGVWTYNTFAWILGQGTFGQSNDLPAGMGMTGLTFSGEDGLPRVGVEMPYRETPIKFSFCHEDRTEPEETLVELPSRTPLTGRLVVGLAEPQMQAYSQVLRYLRAKQGPRELPVSDADHAAVEHAAHAGLLRWHYDSRNGAIFESAAFDRHFGRKGNYVERTHMHAGWLSGIFAAYTLLLAGRETSHADSITVGTSVINKFCAELAPCGTIFPVWTEEHGWACSFGPDDGTAHSRTVAEGILFLLRAMALEMKHNAQRPEWSDAALNSLNYAVGAQREDGALPAYYDLTTGRPTSYEGCAGMAWIAALAVGSTLLQRPHFRDVAVRAAEYYAPYVRRGFIYGCVEDQPCTPTSDDAQWALMSYLALYDADHDERWLDLACKAADLALSWRFVQNIEFSPHSLLGRYGFRTNGGDIGSVACPVTGCTGLMVYRELLKLASYTGEEYYRIRAEDSRAFATQLVLMEDGHYNGRSGMILGQVFHTDWWQPKGVALSLSNAMAGAAVKYAEMMRRHLNITEQSIAAARANGEAIALSRVMYSDIAVAATSEEEGESALSSGLFSMFARRGEQQRGAEESGMGFGEGDPSQSGYMRRFGTPPAQQQSIPGLAPRDRSSRGLSSDNVPLPNYGTNQPVPFPRVDEPQPAAEAPRVSGDEVEIKYKIF